MSPLYEQIYFWCPEWPIFYLDNHIIAIYKPAGLATQGTSQSKHSLFRLVKWWIKIRFEKPGDAYIGIVHRLDKPVAGVCVFAKTSKGAARLSAQFREHKVKKEYIAVVEGIPRRPSGNLIHHLEWTRKEKRAHVTTENDGKSAILEYTILDTYQRKSLLRIIPVTGRKHQIRAQLAAAGFPVLGDVKYGSHHCFPGRAIALYARKIMFIHPTSREPISIESPEPKGWPWHQSLFNSSRIEMLPPWNWQSLVSQVPEIPHQEKPCTISIPHDNKRSG